MRVILFQRESVRADGFAFRTGPAVLTSLMAAYRVPYVGGDQTQMGIEESLANFEHMKLSVAPNLALIESVYHDKVVVTC